MQRRDGERRVSHVVGRSRFPPAFSIHLHTFPNHPNHPNRTKPLIPNSRTMSSTVSASPQTEETDIDELITAFERDSTLCGESFHEAMSRLAHELIDCVHMDKTPFDTSLADIRSSLYRDYEMKHCVVVGKLPSAFFEPLGKLHSEFWDLKSEAETVVRDLHARSSARIAELEKKLADSSTPREGGESNDKKVEPGEESVDESVTDNGRYTGARETPF